MPLVSTRWHVDLKWRNIGRLKETAMTRQDTPPEGSFNRLVDEQLELAAVKLPALMPVHPSPVDHEELKAPHANIEDLSRAPEGQRATVTRLRLKGSLNCPGFRIIGTSGCRQPATPSSQTVSPQTTQLRGGAMARRWPSACLAGDVANRVGGENTSR